jgi:two-component system sensor histidine kinase KdpD
LDNKWSSAWWGYLISFGMILVATVAGRLLVMLPIFDLHNMVMVYILCVALSTYFFGFGPSLMASFLSVLAFDFFFIPPLLTFTVATQQDILSLLILFVVTVVISCLSPKIR